MKLNHDLVPRHVSADGGQAYYFLVWAAIGVSGLCTLGICGWIVVWAWRAS